VHPNRSVKASGSRLRGRAPHFAVRCDAVVHPNRLPQRAHRQQKDYKTL
jgi:hypothetical protein